MTTELFRNWPVIPTLGRQRQAELSEFKASLVYKASSRTIRTVTQRNSVSKQQQQPKSEFNPGGTSKGFNTE